MKRIAVITTTRADYGYLRPVAKQISLDNELELELIATGMHSWKEFGKTIDYIKKDFSDVREIPVSIPENSEYGNLMLQYNTLRQVGEALSRSRPNFVVILGDRIEIMGVACAAVYQNIPLAHVHGGDKSEAGLDESTRHAITKLAHVHFPATYESEERIIKMGEERSRIFKVGSPSLDELVSMESTDEDTLRERYNLTGDYALVVQHPVTSEHNLSGKQFDQTMQALEKSKLDHIIVYPNIDLGSKEIITRIRARQKQGAKVVKSLPREDYGGLMKACSLMIGNSSSGITEAASFKVPVIDIGIRQKGRERSKNVISADHDAEKIYGAIQYALDDKGFRKILSNVENVYGDGCASERITNILRNMDMPLNKLLQKTIIY